VLSANQPRCCAGGDMSTTLFLLLPIGVLATAWSLCFVGCAWVAGLGPGYTLEDMYQYQDTVTGTAGLVAFWPLDETSGTIAVDIGPNHFNGTYITGPNVPAYNAAEQSDAAPGTFTLNQPNIVTGDTVNNNPNAPTPCVYFDGGYVEVLWQAALGPPLPQSMQPPLQFTLEAWVMPDWTLQDAQTNPSYRAVVASNSPTSNPPTAFQGFLLCASPENLWTIFVGDGSQNQSATTGNNQTIVQKSLYFLVVTYDGSKLTLWVNPADTTQPPDAQIATGFVPVASPIPFYIGIGRPDLATPLLPFNGWIQDVAFYNVVLDGTTIEKHYANGSGIT
jgi:Concanavalin A-like lectin/glucanases superfamily